MSKELLSTGHGTTWYRIQFTGSANVYLAEISIDGGSLYQVIGNDMELVRQWNKRGVIV